jgi:RNA-directed DNA polymerase
LLAGDLESHRSFARHPPRPLCENHKCTYSRYADDITFSKSRKDLPPELAVPDAKIPNKWALSAALVTRIEGAGFKVNEKKTRMQIRGSRQVVTSLMTSVKVNVGGRRVF